VRYVASSVPRGSFSKAKGSTLPIIERPGHPPWVEGVEGIEGVQDERGSEWSKTDTNMEKG
jgi:hypothetical protein